MRNLHPDLSGLTNISDVLESLHLAILSIRDPIQWAVERHKAQEQEKTQQKWKETFIQWTKQGYFLFHLINQEHHDWLGIQYQESLIWIRGTEELRRLLIHHYFIRLEDVPHPRKRKLPSLFVAGEDNSQQEIRKTKYQKKSHVPTPTISKKQSIPFYFSKAVPDLHTLPKVDTPTTSFSFCAPSAPILHRSLRALDRIWQGVREAVERTSHNWKEGSRMGEAKNPGPAYTTPRRRLNTRNLSPNPNQPIDNTMPFDSRYWSPPRRWEPPHRANPPVRPYVGGKQESRDGRSGCLSSSSPPYGRNLLFRNCVNNTPKASYYPERSNIQLPSARPCHYGQFCWWKNCFCPFQHPPSITSHSRGSIVAPNTRQPRAQHPYHSLSQSTIPTHNYWSPLQPKSRRYMPSRDPDPAALGEWPVKQVKAADGSTHPSLHSNNIQHLP